MTSIFLKMEDDIHLNKKWKTTSIFLKMEDNLIFNKLKTTFLFDQIEDNLNIVVNGPPHQPKKYWHNSENKNQINLNWL